MRSLHFVSHSVSLFNTGIPARSIRAGQLQMRVRRAACLKSVGMGAFMVKAMSARTLVRMDWAVMNGQRRFSLHLSFSVWRLQIATKQTAREQFVLIRLFGGLRHIFVRWHLRARAHTKRRNKTSASLRVKMHYTCIKIFRAWKRECERRFSIAHSACVRASAHAKMHLREFLVQWRDRAGEAARVTWACYMRDKKSQEFFYLEWVKVCARSRVAQHISSLVDRWKNKAGKAASGCMFLSWRDWERNTKARRMQGERVGKGTGKRSLGRTFGKWAARVEDR